MEWIVYGFFGVLGVIVAAIIGIAVYQAARGKGKSLPNLGPDLQSRAGDVTDIQTRVGGGGGGGGGGMD